MFILLTIFYISQEIIGRNSLQFEMYQSALLSFSHLKDKVNVAYGNTFIWKIIFKCEI